MRTSMPPALATAMKHDSFPKSTPMTGEAVMVAPGDAEKRNGPLNSMEMCGGGGAVQCA